MDILIVDDEVPAVKGILKIIDWKKLSIENTYTAYSVTEAMEQISKRPIQLLLSDIEMRGGTGFDLIRWCNASNMRYISIILSSFPNFHYAQRAITLGVFEYLLKPIDDHDLEAALHRAIAHLNQMPLKAQRSTENQLISQVKDYIYEHISHEITRNDIASHVGLNPEYLSTFFKKETGNTLSDFIKQRRIVFAKRLLKQTNLPISMIAQNVGYDSLSYFSSVFHQLSGLTPREYRKQTDA